MSWRTFFNRKPKPDVPQSKSGASIEHFNAVSEAIHCRMTGQSISRTLGDVDDGFARVVADVDAMRGDSEASKLSSHIRALYVVMFSSLNNVNPRMDREAINSLATLGVNFQAVNELGQTPRDILVSIINSPSSDADSRRQAGVDLAYLEWVLIASETLADEEVE